MAHGWSKAHSYVEEMEVKYLIVYINTFSVSQSRISLVKSTSSAVQKEAKKRCELSQNQKNH